MRETPDPDVRVTVGSAEDVVAFPLGISESRRVSRLNCASTLLVPSYTVSDKLRVA